MSVLLHELEATGHSVPLLAAGLVLFGFILYHIFLGATNKLNHVPGPFYSSFTNLIFKWHNLRGNRWDYVHSLHQKYGDLVRVSPYEVSVTTTQATKELYKMGSHYYKTSFYQAFKGAPGEPTNLFSEQDNKIHSTHRRRNAFQFSEHNVKSMEPHIRRNVSLAVQRMGEDIASNSVTDVFKWFLFMATDVIGEASFGESFKMLETGEKNQYSHDLEIVGSAALYRNELPWLMRIARPLGLNKKISRIADRMSMYATDRINAYWEAYRNDPDNLKPTLLTKTFAMVEDGTLPPSQLKIDARGNIIAGTDTTANTATSIIYLLAQHPSIQTRLIHEIHTLLPPTFSDEDCRRLPLLNNIIHETLRLRPPVGQSLPRSVPPSGTTLSSTFLPGGTIIGVPAYSIHRNPSIFPHPDDFNPDRWNEETAEMKEAFVAFGGGSRVCIGMHFAQLELRLAVCEFYRRFGEGVEMVDVEAGREGMRAFQSFLSGPRGKMLVVQERGKE